MGGKILDAVLTRPVRGARIVLYGSVSQHNVPQARGPSNYLAMFGARASMTGSSPPTTPRQGPSSPDDCARTG